MTYKEIAEMIAGIGLPYAYYEFPDGTEQAPPFICFFFPEDANVFADNSNYVDKKRLYVELYTDEKDFTLESTVEAALQGAGLTYYKTETHIGSERMWQILYEMEVIING